jgi:hypothetical protein
VLTFGNTFDRLECPPRNTPDLLLSASACERWMDAIPAACSDEMGQFAIGPSETVTPRRAKKESALRGPGDLGFRNGR